MSDPMALREKARKERRIWFHRPEKPWRGWASWRLWWRSSDEYGRRTLVIGPDITGSVVIAYRVCTCEHCDASREQTARFEDECACCGTTDNLMWRKGDHAFAVTTICRPCKFGACEECR